jgi:hypothetical protein
VSVATVLCWAVLITAMALAMRYEMSRPRKVDSAASDSPAGEAVVCEGYAEIEREYLRALELRRQVRGRAAGSRRWPYTVVIESLRITNLAISTAAKLHN